MVLGGLKIIPSVDNKAACAGLTESSAKNRAALMLVYTVWSDAATFDLASWAGRVPSNLNPAGSTSRGAPVPVFLGLGARWRAEAVTSSSHVLAKAGDGSFRPRPAIAKQQRAQVVTSRGWRDQLTLIAMISWTFLLRVQSE